MSISIVVVAAWTLFLSLVAVWSITYALRFFVVRKEGHVVMPGHLFMRSVDLNERGRLLWKIRNILLIVAIILLPTLWSLQPPS